MSALRAALVAAILSIASFAQTVTLPGSTSPGVSTSWLYYNKMRWAGAWSSTATYNPQDVVTYGSYTYVSLSASSLDHTPAPGGTAWWAQLPTNMSFPSGAPLQYLRIKPNTVGTNFEFAALPAFNVPDFNFPPQAPGGSLLAGGVGQVIAMAPCPLGMAGADTGHYVYLSGGTGTAEAVLITGGTCTSGAAAGTITITPAQAHSGAWTVSSASAGIQEAIVAAGTTGGGKVLIPAGTYALNATINASYHGIHIFGAGGIASGITGTVLQRTGDYGNTMTVTGAYDFAITDVQFIHVSNYNSAVPSMDNKITAHLDSSHLEINGSQGSRIEHCAFLDMRYGVTINGGAHFAIDHNYFRGLWDPKNAAVQQTVASLRLAYKAGSGSPTNIIIADNYFSGYFSVSRSRTVGSVTFSAVENVGPQYGILAANFENIQIRGGIIEKSAVANLAFINNTTQIALGAEVHNLQLDGAGQFDVFFDNQNTNSGISNVTISGCTFNGEVTGLSAIYTPTHPTYPNMVYGLTITGNTIQAYLSSALMLGGAQGVTIIGNSIRGYNAVNGFADNIFGVAILIYGSTNGVTIEGNNIGGGNSRNCSGREPIRLSASPYRAT